ARRKEARELLQRARQPAPVGQFIADQEALLQVAARLRNVAERGHRPAQIAERLGKTAALSHPPPDLHRFFAERPRLLVLALIGAEGGQVAERSRDMGRFLKLASRRQTPLEQR